MLECVCVTVCVCVRLCVCKCKRALKNGCILTCILVKSKRALPIGWELWCAAKILRTSANQSWDGLISANCRQIKRGGLRKRGWGKDLSLLIFKLKFERAEFSIEGGGRWGSEGGELREEGDKDVSFSKHHYFLIKLPIPLILQRAKLLWNLFCLSVRLSVSPTIRISIITYFVRPSVSQ